MNTSGTTDVDRIRERAYELWRQDGCPEGRAMDYWLRAEADLAGEAGTTMAETPTPAAADEPTPKRRSARAPAAAKPAAAKPAAAKPAGKAKAETGGSDRARRSRGKAEG